ncbi:MAG: sugar transferase [Candidatus Omnitrophota bacterium]
MGSKVKQRIKRIMDIVLALAGIIVFGPLLVVVAIAIKLTSSGPALFRQERCGLNGKKFILYKFRTMVDGAENKLSDLLKHNEMDGPVFKMRNDPRIAPLGNILRRFSIDEFPQLWNVLKGQMSLVGPRPPLPKEVVQYDERHMRRLSVKPGITCLWQVRGRNEIVIFDRWIDLDLEYIDNWSLKLDMKILLNTIPAVLSGNGAR